MFQFLPTSCSLYFCFHILRFEFLCNVYFHVFISVEPLRLAKSLLRAHHSVVHPCDVISCDKRWPNSARIALTPSLINCSVVKRPFMVRRVVESIPYGGPSELSFVPASAPWLVFPFQPVVHNWFIKGRGMYCSVYGKVHIKDPLLLIEKSSLCGGSGFPSKKCVNVTIWMTSNNRW